MLNIKIELKKCYYDGNESKMNMKYLLLITLLLSSCAMNIKDDMFLNLPNISSPQDASNWCYQNIRYELRDKKWKRPDVIIREGKGLCKDFCVVMMYILKKQGIDSEYIVIKIDNIKSHALVRCNDIYYDPTNESGSTSTYDLSIYPILCVYSFTEVNYYIGRDN